jgi:hypothetical protein
MAIDFLKKILYDSNHLIKKFLIMFFLLINILQDLFLCIKFINNYFLNINKKNERISIYR